MNLSTLARLPVIGIIRGVTEATLHDTLQAGLDGGLNTIEITLNTPNALKLITKSIQILPLLRNSYTPKQSSITNFSVGAGTVCNLNEAKVAVDAGASFIVSPIADLPTITWCTQQNIPIYAGALTPNEVHLAWEAGATMVKVFPAGSLGGPEYIKQLKGPFNAIKLLACSGVTPYNLTDYFEAGVSAIAIGNSVFKQEWMNNGEFDKIKESAKKYVEAYKWLSKPSE